MTTKLLDTKIVVAIRIVTHTHTHTHTHTALGDEPYLDSQLPEHGEWRLTYRTASRLAQLSVVRCTLVDTVHSSELAHVQRIAIDKHLRGVVVQTIDRLRTKGSIQERGR
jgi:hypothetical protein